MNNNENTKSLSSHDDCVLLFISGILCPLNLSAILSGLVLCFVSFAAINICVVLYSQHYFSWAVNLNSFSFSLYLSLCFDSLGMRFVLINTKWLNSPIDSEIHFFSSVFALFHQFIQKYSFQSSDCNVHINIQTNTSYFYYQNIYSSNLFTINHKFRLFNQNK